MTLMKVMGGENKIYKGWYLKMMITENYRVIATDDRNIILQKKVTPKDKDREVDEEKQWRVDGYYSSFKAAYKAMVKRELLGDGLKDFESIVAKIELLERKIEKLG